MNEEKYNKLNELIKQEELKGITFPSYSFSEDVGKVSICSWCSSSNSSISNENKILSDLVVSVGLIPSHGICKNCKKSFINSKNNNKSFIILSESVEKIIIDGRQQPLSEEEHAILLDIAIDISRFMMEFVPYADKLMYYKNKVLGYKIILDALHYNEDYKEYKKNGKPYSVMIDTYKKNNKSYYMINDRTNKSIQVYNTLSNTFYHIQDDLLKDPGTKLPSLKQEEPVRKNNKMTYYYEKNTRDLVENIAFIHEEIKAFVPPSGLYDKYNSIVSKIGKYLGEIEMT